MSARERRSILFWTWVLFSVSILYFLYAGGTLGYNFWWINKYRLSVDRKLPIVEIIYCVISVCNFTLSIVGITVSIHLMAKRKSRITLQAHGLIVSLALVVSVIISAAMVILDNVAKVMKRIPNMKPEDYFIQSPTEEFFYTIVILPLGHALFLSVISGLSLGLNTRIHKVKENVKIDWGQTQLHA